MTLQERTLRLYMEVKKQPSLREIAKETGIQQTRVFRLLNGTKMRLEEWEIFNNLVEESVTGIEKLARDCLRELTLNQLTEVQGVMKKKLEWQRSIEMAHQRLQKA